MNKPRKFFIAALTQIYQGGLAGLITFSYLSICYSGASVKEAAYVEAVTDDLSLGIKRTYHSRSLHHGIFGFGWCSPLESRIKQNKSGTFVVLRCGLRVADNSLRVTTVKGRTISQSSAAREVYDGLGRLRSFTISGSGSVRLFYNKLGLINRIQNSSGRVATLSYGRGGARLQRMTINDGTQIVYRYHGTNLVQVHSSKSGQVKYSYDSYHNLVGILKKGALVRRMSYDSEKDWLKALREGKCLSSFDYLERSSVQHYIVREQNWCSGKLVGDNLYEFDRGKLRSAKKGSLGQVKFHYDKKGRLVKVQGKDGETISLNYRRGKSSPSRIMHSNYGDVWLFYDGLGRVKSMHSIQGDDVAVSVAQRVTEIMALVSTGN